MWSWDSFLALFPAQSCSSMTFFLPAMCQQTFVPQSRVTLKEAAAPLPPTPCFDKLETRIVPKRDPKSIAEPHANHSQRKRNALATNRCTPRMNIISIRNPIFFTTKILALVLKIMCFNLLKLLYYVCGFSSGQCALQFSNFHIKTRRHTYPR